MRALAISDLHFGAWTADPLLRHDFALDALEPHLEDIDELILLGDVFDLLFSSVGDAFAQADRFFDLVHRKLQGGRVVFLAGNHDHHIVVRDLRTAVELRVATGEWHESRNFLQRFLDRRLDGVESRIVYPTYRVGDVLLSHGHYLDAHLRNSIGNRALARSAWTVAGGRPEWGLRTEDYESVIVPLTELLFTVAQMPRGTAAQQAFYARLRRLGRLASLPDLLRRRRNTDFPGASACDPAAPQRVGLEAFAKVVRNLGWDREARHVVFAHTHQPLDGVCASEGDVRYWNTGSWVYDPPRGSRAARECYVRRAWPGTAVLVDTDREAPQLVRMLGCRAQPKRSHGHGLALP
jgi:UDP-2,3-diacylglucosamine pyrophosphatase LpxH